MSLWASHWRLPGAAAGDHRDEAHAFFDQPAGQQAAAGVVVGRLDAYAVEVESFLGFVRDVERRRRLGLHLERQIVTADAGVELIVPGFRRGFVERPDQGDGFLAVFAGDARGQIQVEHGAVSGAESRGLIDGGEKTVHVHRLSGFERAVGVGHDDVGRQGAGLGAQPVNDPRAHRGEARGDASGHELVLRGGMDDHVAVAGAQDGDVVDACGGMGQQIGDLDSALSVLSEGPLGAQQHGVFLDELVLGFAEFGGAGLAVELVEQRFRVEGFDVAGPAGHEEEND